MFDVKKNWSIIAPITVALATYASVGLPLSISAAVWWVVNMTGVIFVLSAAFNTKYTPLLSVFFTMFFGGACLANGLYANAVINMCVLAPLSVIGANLSNKALLIGKLTNKKLFGFTAVCFVALYFLFITANSAQSHFTDALSAAMIVTATFLLMIKDTRCWNWWVTINLVEIILWFNVAAANPEAISMLVLRIVFFFNSIIGFLEWRKKTDLDCGTL